MQSLLKLFNLRLVDRRQSRLLSEADILEEDHGSQYMMFATCTMIFIIFLLLVWASLTYVNETSDAKGIIVPENNEISMQAADGGVIQKVLVDNFTEVMRDQPILNLDSTIDQADKERLLTKALALKIEIKRLRALLNGKSVKVSELISQVAREKELSENRIQELTKFLHDEMDLLGYEHRLTLDQQSILHAEIGQHKSFLEFLRQQKTNLGQQLGLMEKEQAMYKQLNDSNVVSKREVLSAERNYLRAKREYLQISGEIEKSAKILAGSQNRLAEAVSKIKKATSEKISEASAELLSVQNNLEKMRTKVGRMQLVSPVDGTVKGLELRPGNVVKPGQELLQIVPEGAKLVVEAKIIAKEIGHIKPGDEVKVKVTTYDYARYGYVPGRVKSVSASSFTDESMPDPYYKSVIELEKNYVGNNPNVHVLKPGMTVVASIVTGTKTLMQYILKPIHLTVSSAFSER